MAEGGVNRHIGVSDSDGKGVGERSRAEVVHSPSQAPVWSSYKLIEDKIEHLQQYFSKVLVMLESLLDDSHRKWKGLAVIFRSLGHLAPSARMAKEVRVRLKLADDPKVFPVGEDHLVLRLGSKEDCTRVLEGGPWYVDGQLMAMARWQSNFLLGRKSINRTVLWMHLSELLLEY